MTKEQHIQCELDFCCGQDISNDKCFSYIHGYEYKDETKNELDEYYYAIDSLLMDYDFEDFESNVDNDAILDYLFYLLYPEYKFD